MGSTTYPTWRYHATEAPRIITGPEQEAPGWTDSPADHGREAFNVGATAMTGLPMQFSPAPAKAAAVVGPESAAPKAKSAKKRGKAD